MPPGRPPEGGEGSQQVDSASLGQVILADPPTIAPLITGATSLKWMQSTYAGVDALFKASSAKQDYVCTRVSGVFGQQISEYVMGWLLALRRGIFVATERQAAGVWDEGARAAKLSSMTLGVLGAGDIGAHLAGVSRARPSHPQ